MKNFKMILGLLFVALVSFAMVAPMAIAEAGDISHGASVTIMDPQNIGADQVLFSEFLFIQAPPDLYQESAQDIKPSQEVIKTKIYNQGAPLQLTKWPIIDNRQVALIPKIKTMQRKFLARRQV